MRGRKGLRRAAALLIGCAVPLTAAFSLGGQLRAAAVGTVSAPQPDETENGTENGAEDAAGDAAKGKILFEKRCAGCHALEENREGPRLGGVFGRRSGEVHDFPYSAALAKAGITWDEATLDRWLTDTDSLVPGNNMDFRVPKQEERRYLISFLRQKAGK
jgi:cytochrome c